MAITQATSLADFSTGIGTAGAVLQVDNADERIGIGTTDPQGTLQVGIAITMDGTAGVITASSFSGSGANLTFTGADISAATASFTGNVSVGGTLTYEDVTNVDAVGVITARSDVSIADKIVHTGDTNTAIRFPAADTFTVETGGSERVRVGAAGSVGIGTDDPESALHVVGNIPNAPMNFGVHIGAHSGYGIMQFTAATGGIIDFGESGVDSVGRIIYTHSNDALAFQTGNSEAFRVNSSQRLVVGASSALSNVKIDSNTGSPLFQVEGSTYQTAAISLTRTANSSPYIYLNSGSSGNNATGSLGRIMFNGFDGTNYVAAASISGLVNGTPGTDDMPGALLFQTSSDGSQVPTERLRITSAGNVGINETSPQQQLHVHDDTSYHGIFVNGNGAPRINFARSTTTTAEWSVGVDGTDGTRFAIADSAGNTAHLTITTGGLVTVTGTLNATTDVQIGGKSAATAGKAVAMALVFG